MEVLKSKRSAVMALVALQFKQADAHDAVRSVLSKKGADTTVEEIVRACLKKGS